MGLFGTSAWEQARDSKLAVRATALAQIPASSVQLGDIEILSCTTPELVKGIEARKWTSTAVLHAFIRSTVRAHAATNAVTEVLFSEALNRAGELDREFEKTGVLVGPLHGVPISIKDQLDIAGFDTTIGFTQDCLKPATKDAALVSLLREAGAVPFVKTNVPQTMLAFECGNPLFGSTTNPYNQAHTSGGSSGGEAALLASDASPVGIGSDIGGSLRIPAHYSGCYGLKPSPGRFPNSGAKNPNPGFESIKSTLGPLGRSIDDLEAICRVVFDASPTLARTEPMVPLPFRDVTLPKVMKFGYYLTGPSSILSPHVTTLLKPPLAPDGFCRASPASSRAVLTAVEALRAQGHEVVEFAPLDPIAAMEYFVALTSSGGYQTLLSGLRGDPAESSLFLVTLGPKLPFLVRNAASWLMENFLGDDKMARIVGASRVKGMVEHQEWANKRDKYVQEFREHVWGKLKLDGIICAPQAVPALQLGQTWDLSPLAIGTILYNLVDCVAGVIPVTHVDPRLDAITPEWLALGQKGSALVEDRVYGAKSPAYDAAQMDGLPIGVQIVGAAFEEEKVLKMMRVVEEAIVVASGTGEKKFGPGKFVARSIDK